MIPHARGLGSSSAAIVAGRRARPRRWSPAAPLLLDDDAVFRLAARHRGPPRQRRAGVLRRLRDLRAARTARSTPSGSPVDPRVAAVVFVPPDPVSTEVARGLLPAEVPHADAAANAGRTALLVAALAGQPGAPAARATRDYLHQELPPAGDAGVARPGRRAARRRRRRRSSPGAGPTVLAFTDGRRRRRALAARCPAGLGRADHLDVDRDGAGRAVTRRRSHP